ncbi:MAG: 4Fe-4S binding protein [Bacteroidaceae bacterium]|nr:4Fe-4S binding protein [Bacteroidaceae bacterium]
MAVFKGFIEVDTERCKGCNLCAEACPLHLIELSQHVNRHGYNYAVQTDAERCNGCSSCGIMCPDGCITVYRIKE